MTPRQKYDQLFAIFRKEQEEEELNPSLRLIFKETDRGQSHNSAYFGQLERRIYLPLWLLNKVEPWRVQYLLHEISHQIYQYKPGDLPHCKGYKDTEYRMCGKYGIVIPGWTRPGTLHGGKTEPNAYADRIIFNGKTYPWGASNERT